MTTPTSDRLPEALDIVRAALEHRRDYDARHWSHVDCGAEEDIRERLALAALATRPEPGRPADWLMEFAQSLPEEQPTEVRRVLTNEGLILVVGPIADRPEPGELDPRIIAAFDHLGGMWSWSEANGYFATGGGWVLDAGRLLREVVGRPARQPDADELALAAALREAR